MLPFPIISNTNIIPKMDDIRMTASEYSQVFSLIYNNTLYLSGQNDAYQLGDNTTINKYNQWIKVPENEPVKLCSTGYTQTVYVTINGKVMITGNDITVLPTVSRHTWYDITSVLSSQIDTTKIKFINVDRYGLIVILENGTVWGCGSDSTGWMGTGSIPSAFVSFRQIHAGPAVAGICGTGVCRIVLEDGTILGAGSNSNNKIDATSTSNYSTFVQSFPDVNPSLICQFKICQNNAMIFLSDRKFYGTGWGSYGSLGDGNTTSANYGFRTGTLSVVPANLRMFDHLQCNSYSSSSFVLSTDGELWGCGFTSYNLISTSTSIGTFTKCLQLQTYSGMRLMVGNTNVCLYNPQSSILSAAWSSPRSTTPTPQANVPVLGMGTILPLTLPV